MISEKVYRREPSFIIPPGETLRETIELKELSQSDLAKRTGRPLKTINGIIQGHNSITSETALQFEKVLGIPCSFWLNLEKNYQEALVKKKEEEKLQKQSDWLKRFPVKEMIKRNWINKHDNAAYQIEGLLKYFGVASINTWDDFWNPEIAFRKSDTYKSELSHLAAWIRKAELEAESIKCNSFDKQSLKDDLPLLRELTKEADPNIFIPKLTEICAKNGVAVIFLKELPKCRVSGATKWLNPSKALIILSLRHKTNDHLWFTFFHEMGHILKHGKKITFVDENGNKEIDEKEEEANNFSASILIPEKEYKQFIATSPKSYSEVMAFANKIDIAPGIVVGRLQKDKIIPYKNLNKLKVSYSWPK